MADDDKKLSKTATIIIIVVVIVYFALSIIALILSITCFDKSGTDTQKVLGLVLALLFGAFYLLYYAFAGSYCVNNRYISDDQR